MKHLLARLLGRLRRPQPQRHPQAQFQPQPQARPEPHPYQQPQPLPPSSVPECCCAEPPLPQPPVYAYAFPYSCPYVGGPSGASGSAVHDSREPGPVR
ncbi:hypothetical protein [Streptomyces candidus]|uniref:Uncharacterized protein n=1 Tax=Streptomyces candidus TaxID=67283 RepID=A0A7X0HIM3_9ACTN|nr:hypothetical protein [Streptomyces candidus]MBB6437062.1 hypothetical protein [Streptomyces candidus]GHH32828.1 hypothetical protein GCM10018773_02470 [Streptomyces candidus]